jgi:ADP-ribose pyrophosphatase YjhB (NUDIX family)
MMESMIKLLIEQGDLLLFLDNAINTERSFYELPSGSVYPDESQQQALQRILMETVRLSLKNVVKLLIYKDSFIQDRFTRTFYLIIEVHDPEDIFLTGHRGFGWVEPKEAFGYPIKEDLREILDLYLKTKQL